MMLPMFKNLTLCALAMFPLIAGGCGSKPETPASMFDAIKEATATNDPVLVWDSFPSSWQAQADGLVHEIGRKVPAEFYDRVMATARKIFVILRTKREFVLNTPLVTRETSQMSPEEYAAFNTIYDAVVTVGSIVTESDLSSAAGLQRFSIGSFLRKHGKALHTSQMVVIRAMATAGGEQGQGMTRTLMVMEQIIPQMGVTILSETDSTATLQITGVEGLHGYLGLQAESSEPLEVYVEMTKFEGKWVPTEFVDEVPQMMQEAMDMLPLVSNSISQEISQATMLLNLVDAIVEPMEKAKTQAEFDQALASIAPLLGG